MNIRNEWRLTEGRHGFLNKELSLDIYDDDDDDELCKFQPIDLWKVFPTKEVEISVDNMRISALQCNPYLCSDIFGRDTTVFQPPLSDYRNLRPQNNTARPGLWWDSGNSFWLFRSCRRSTHSPSPAIFDKKNSIFFILLLFTFKYTAYKDDWLCASRTRSTACTVHRLW